MMLTRETLVLSRHLKWFSIPSSRSWMLDSNFPNQFCTLYTFIKQSDLFFLWPMSDCNAASTFSSSLTFFSSPLDATLLGCTSLETKDQLLKFVCSLFPAQKVNTDSRTAELTVSTSLNVLMIAWVSWFLLMELLSMPFRAFWTAFMTSFLVVKYFPTFLASLVSPPRLLRIVDYSSSMHAFISNKVSLAMLQTSNSLRDPSNSWSNHFLCWSWMNSCWVRGNRSNLSTQSCKSWRSISLWHIDDDEVASEVFSLHNAHLFVE